MLLRLVLFVIFAVIVARAFWRLVDGILEGLGGAPRGRGRGPSRGVQMVRDPVCGTFVVRDRALPLAGTSGTTIYFCSTECRDKYRARPASPSSAHGRTA
jgi:uncharacterized protein